MWEAYRVIVWEGVGGLLSWRFIGTQLVDIQDLGFPTLSYLRQHNSSVYSYKNSKMKSYGDPTQYVIKIYVIIYNWLIYNIL